MNKPVITEADLHAYVDAQLSEAQRDCVDAYLAGNAKEGERLRAYQEHKHALRRLFNPVLDEALPVALLNLAVRPEAGAGRRYRGFLAGWPRWQWQRLAAGIAIAAVGAAAGWLGRGQYFPADQVAQTTPFPRQAAIAHALFSPDVRRPVEITAEHEDQLVTWLSKRLGVAVRPPKLGALGYELVGGRLLPGDSGPVAQFMYQDASGQRLTLYVSTDNSGKTDTAFRFAQEGPVNVFYWIDGKFGYALSGGIDKGELARLAKVVYDQFEHK